MRNITIGSYTVTIPDEHTWAGDSNLVTFKDNSSPAGFKGEVIVGGKHLQYTTEGAVLVIDITDTLNLMQADTAQTCEFYVTPTGGTRSGVARTIINHLGKTLASRHHGSATTIEVDDIENVKIYANGANVKVNDQDGNEIYTAANGGIHTINTGGSEVLYVSHDGPSGHRWSSDESTSNMAVRLVQSCNERESVTIHYYDTDGIERTANGKVMSAPLNVNHNEYTMMRGSVRNEPRRVVTSVVEEISVGFVDVDPGQYLEDVMMSFRVWIGDMDVIPTTLTATRDDVAADIVINFKILA